MQLMKCFFVCLTACMFSFSAFAQPERQDVRRGNKAYKAEQYEDAEVAYMHGLDKNPESFGALFNLGSALYKLERQEQAEKTFNGLSKVEIDSIQKAAVFHNLGNTGLQQKKWQESVNAYKQALRYHPSDMETKQNLAYAQMMLQNQENQQEQDNNQDNQEQEQEQEQEQDQNENENQQQDNQEQEQQQEPKISKQDAQRMLEAMQANERETQEKVQREKANAVKQIQIEKNW